MKMIIEFNLFDLLYIKKIIASLKEYIDIIAYFAMMLYYLFLIVILRYYFSEFYEFSTITSANYIENNSKWFKTGNNQILSPESYCYIDSPLNGLFKTVDLAMLTTLPRLYDFSKNDEKCFIKPSMRGLFNSTMKYIFGKDYENDDINIFCKKLFNYPALVITSEKILNQTLSYFIYDKNITYLDKQINISNKDYFQEVPYKPLPMEMQNLLNIYENCSIQYGPDNCETQWDNFTQNYWPKMHSIEYEDIPGFEKYQITVSSDFVFQPRFITSSGKYMSGTHYIVGGSDEDEWGADFLTEAFSRKYTPLLFEFLFPLYKLIREKFKNIFIRLEDFNKIIIFSEPLIEPEIKKLTKLYSQFNLSHEALFTVGHSIGGTLMKGISYYSDIRGIVFEASDAENTDKKNFDPEFNISTRGVNKVINLYTEKSKMSGLDNDFYINNKMLKGFKRPTAYKTACLTAITCSETMKYVPFCKQTFSLDGINSEKDFLKNLNAYLDEFWIQQ